MGQRPSTLTPNQSPRHLLGAELRRWRELRGLSAARLAERVFASGDLVSKVEKAQRNASAELIAACDVALDTGGALGRLLDFAVHHEHQAEPEAEAASVPPVVSPEPVSILVRITAELAPLTVSGGAVDAALPGTGGARIYRFPPASQRGRS
ncbi:helix-turn-helix transcriptional regulator [Dactylosporangium sp. NPDC051485]|uniref:helix-turn-helix domain-containing protein n=1 Tax=Dactylosporangium sp. NPDC051485 TaxID=3154846 RepID=UPI00343BD37E